MTAHIASLWEMFKEYIPVTDGSGVKGVGNLTTKVTGRGTVVLRFDLRAGKSATHKLKNVLHLPMAGICLLSISKLAEWWMHRICTQIHETESKRS